MWRAHAGGLPAHPAPHHTGDTPRHGVLPDASILGNTVANRMREVTIAWPDEHCRLTMIADAPLAVLLALATANAAAPVEVQTRPPLTPPASAPYRANDPIATRFPASAESIRSAACHARTSCLAQAWA